MFLRAGTSPHTPATTRFSGVRRAYADQTLKGSQATKWPEQLLQIIIEIARIST